MTPNRSELLRKFALLVTLLLLNMAVSAQPVARVDTIKGAGNLFVQRPKSAQWYRAHVEMDAGVGDHLRTDASSLATLRFFLGGRANLDSDSEIAIISSRNVDLVSDTISLQRGNFWAKFDKQKTPIKIQTAGGVMGIRGTEFVVQVDDQGNTTLSMLEGEVEVVPVKGSPYAANPGSRVTFGPDTEIRVVLEKLDQMRLRLEEEIPKLSDLQPTLDRLDEAQGQIRDAQLTLEEAQIDRKIDDMLARLEGRGQKKSTSKASEPLQTWPSLSWPAIRGQRFAIMLLPATGSDRDLLWLDQVDGKSYRYPSDAPALNPGLYRYRVIPIDPEGNPLGKAYEGTISVPVGDSAGSRQLQKP